MFETNKYNTTVFEEKSSSIISMRLLELRTDSFNRSQRARELTISIAQRCAAMFWSRRFVTFIAFGGSAAVVNIAVGSALYTLPATKFLIPYWLAVGIGSTAGLLINFVLNYAFNFRYGGRSAKAQLGTFTIVACGGVVLTAVTAEALVQLAGYTNLGTRHSVMTFTVETQWIAHVLATAFVTLYSFAAHSLFSFNRGFRARFPGLMKTISILLLRR